MSVQLPFKHPTTILIAGPTGCGKTQFLLQIIQRQAVQPKPQRIICVYGEWQSAYNKLKSDASKIGATLEFMHNPTAGDMAQLYETITPNIQNMIILDDQMANSQIRSHQGESLTKLFTQGSHHRNLTIIYIVQNIFNQSSEMRNVSLNSHYLVLFKNPRDKTQARVLGQQMFPRNSNFLVAAYEDATSKPHGYLMIDLHPSSDDNLRVRSNIFDKNTIIYLPAESI